jgi:hypothetical protein
LKDDLNLCEYLDYSHIWLNPKDDHHFFDIYLWMITTLATNKNLYKTGLLCPQDTVKKSHAKRGHIAQTLSQLAAL